MADLFDGVDISDLADSEGTVIESGDIKAPAAPEPPAGKTGGEQETPKQDAPVIDGIDINDIANLDEDSDEGGGDNDDDETKTSSRTPASGDSPSSHANDKALNSLASALQEAGVFSSLEEDEVKGINDVDTLLEAIGKQIKANEYSHLTDEQKEYLKAIEAGVDHTEYIQSTSTKNQYASLEDERIKEHPAVARELIRRDFITKGLDEDTAAKYADLAMKSETAIEDALKAKNSLIAYEDNRIQSKIKESEEKRQKELEKEQEQLDSLKSKVKESSEILPGVRVTSNTKDKIFTSMTTPVEVEGDSALNEVMKSYKEDLDYKLKLHAAHVLTKGFTDFSKFKNAAKTSASEELSQVLKSGTSHSAGTPAGSTGGKSTKDIRKSLEDLQLPIQRR